MFVSNMACYNICIMHCLTAIPRFTKSSSYTLSLTECASKFGNGELLVTLPLLMINYFILQLKMTPLHWAVENGHTNVVNLLLKNNAATHLVDKVCLLLYIKLHKYLDFLYQAIWYLCYNSPNLNRVFKVTCGCLTELQLYKKVQGHDRAVKQRFTRFFWPMVKFIYFETHYNLIG